MEDTSQSTPGQPTKTMVISWSEWSPQTSCSVTCGVGVTIRQRFCSVDGQCEGNCYLFKLEINYGKKS